MEPSRRAFLGAVAVTVGLAGCTGDQGEQPTDTETATETAADSPTEQGTETAGAAATVRVAAHPDYGDILVDADGMTLYLFEQDTMGGESSACAGDCADAWPPLVATDEPTAGDGVAAELSTFERQSGEMQVAANGWPLYYFASDDDPGDAEGQGVGDVWWVVAPNGTAVTSDAATATSTSTPTETPSSEGGASGGGDDSYY